MFSVAKETVMCPCAKSSLTSERTVQGGAVAGAVRRIRGKTLHHSPHAHSLTHIHTHTEIHISIHMTTHKYTNDTKVNTQTWIYPCTHEQREKDCKHKYRLFIYIYIYVCILKIYNIIMFLYSMEKLNWRLISLRHGTTHCHHSLILLLTTLIPWNLQPLIIVIQETLLSRTPYSTLKAPHFSCHGWPPVGIKPPLSADTTK